MAIKSAPPVPYRGCGAQTAASGGPWAITPTTGTLVLSGIAPTLFSSPSDLAGLALWLDASDTSTYNNVSGNATYWNDKSPSALNFTGLGAASKGGWISATFQNGKGALIFGLGVGDMMGSDDTAATWAFLHDGTQFQLYAVFMTYDVADGTILGTGTGATPTDTGFLLDHAYVSIEVGDLTHNVGNGSSLVASNVLSGVLVPFGADVTQHVTLAYLESDVSNGTAASRDKIAIDGGSLVGNNTDTGTPDSGSPTGTLVLGGDAGAANAGAVAICELIIVVGTPSTTDRANIESYLTTKWGL